MIIHESCATVATPTGPMLVYLFRPTLGTLAGISTPLGALIVHSEIYQVTGPLRRFCRLLASEGYNAVIGECYHEHLPPGTALPYDDAGTGEGNRLKVAKPAAGFDGDNRAIVNAIKGVVEEVEGTACGMETPLFGQGAWNGRIGSVGMVCFVLRCYEITRTF